MKEVCRTFKFDKPLSADAVYDTLATVVLETGSDDFTFSYERLVHYERKDQKFDAHEANGTGSIRKGKLTLKLSAGSAYLEDTIPQNYFKDLEFSEPTGWKGGSPSLQDHEELNRYTDEVIAALKRTETGRPEDGNEEKAKPMCQE